MNVQYCKVIEIKRSQGYYSCDWCGRLIKICEPYRYIIVKSDGQLNMLRYCKRETCRPPEPSSGSVAHLIQK